jgi:hypothetical protein
MNMVSMCHLTRTTVVGAIAPASWTLVRSDCPRSASWPECSAFMASSTSAKGQLTFAPCQSPVQGFSSPVEQSVFLVPHHTDAMKADGRALCAG